MLNSLRNRLFGNKSKSMAKSRLHFVLVQDRSGLTNEQMADFKRSLLEVMERYFVIDKQAFDIAYKRASETTTLMINSPVIVRRQESVNGQVGARRALLKKKSEEPEDVAEASTEEVQPSANG